MEPHQLLSHMDHILHRADPNQNNPVLIYGYFVPQSTSAWWNSFSLSISKQIPLCALESTISVFVSFLSQVHSIYLDGSKGPKMGNSWLPEHWWKSSWDSMPLGLPPGRNSTDRKLSYSVDMSGCHCVTLAYRNRAQGWEQCCWGTQGASSKCRGTISQRHCVPPTRTQENQVSLKITSVQHYVVDHVAFVFGMIEAERTAEIFGAFLRDRRVPSFHMHSKSRPKRRETETVTESHWCVSCCMSFTGAHVWLSCLRSINWSNQTCLLTTWSLAIKEHRRDTEATAQNLYHLAGIKVSYKRK